MIRDFCRKFSIQRDEITWAALTTDPCAGPLYQAGYKERLRTVTVPGLILAGMFSEENYPERSIEGSVRAGLRAADEITRRQERTGVME